MSKNKQRLLLTGKKKNLGDVRMDWAHFISWWMFSESQSAAAPVFPEVIYSFRGELSSPATLPVSHLAWPAFSAKPGLGLALITHSFNRKCLHFQLSVGGWRADKPWMETQSRFLLHPQIALWSEREQGPPPGPSCLPKGGRMVKLWAFGSSLLHFCSGTFV